MSAVGRKLRDREGNRLAFFCPGCKESHEIRIGEGAGPRWGWNGSGDTPTFTPSVLVRSGHFVPGHEGAECWCTYNAAHPDDPVVYKCAICHSFVTDGRIQFLSDCTHELAGQTVDLPDYPE